MCEQADGWCNYSQLWMQMQRWFRSSWKKHCRERTFQFSTFQRHSKAYFGHLFPPKQAVCSVCNLCIGCTKLDIFFFFYPNWMAVAPGSLCHAHQLQDTFEMSSLVAPGLKEARRRIKRDVCTHAHLFKKNRMTKKCRYRAIFLLLPTHCEANSNKLSTNWKCEWCSHKSFHSPLAVWFKSCCSTWRSEL